LIAYKTSRVFVVPALRQRPLDRGHMLVLPTVHATRLSELEPPLLQELYTPDTDELTREERVELALALKRMLG
jgi:diadenosine tetraphosphate (Ap4A) HIT family hydrolase